MSKLKTEKFKTLYLRMIVTSAIVLFSIDFSKAKTIDFGTCCF